jgi:hypothetical protein
MELGEARQAIDGAANVDELFGVLRGLRDESGLAHLVYHATFVPAFDKANALLMPTYDETWVQHYIARNYFSIDPVVLAGQKGFLPIDWMTLVPTFLGR